MELLYDIATCGMPSFSIKNRYCKRADEIKYKYYLLKTALEVDDHDYITISDNIKYLDSSEKIFISYYIGMFITKLVSRKIFDYEYLVHLGVLSMYKKVVKTNKGPDLVGFNRKNDDYSLFEAKGRQIVRKETVQSAKQQLRFVKYISGIKPIASVVCIAHPIKEGSRLICSMYDLVPDNEVYLETNKIELLYVYYLPVYELIKENGHGETFCIMSFDSIDFQKMEYKITMSKNLFDFFVEYPSLEDWNRMRYYSQLMEFKSISSDESIDHLIKIELI